MAEQLSDAPSDGTPLAPPGLRAAYAKYLLDKHLREKRATRNGGSIETLPHQSLDDLQGNDGTEHLGGHKERICIVGAGAAGLCIAMMLKYLNIDNVDILEATDRVGGRCFTYPFTDSPQGGHNYYDVGAMRIPDIPSMASTLNLVQSPKLLNIPKDLVDYTYRVKNEDGTNYEPSMYWYSHTKSPDGSKFEKAIQQILIQFQADFDKYLEKDDDNYSTRSWLMLKAPPGLRLTYEDTVAGEASDTSTGLFDQGLTETLCDYSDFKAAETKSWYRIENGMSVVTDTMRDRIASADWPVARSPEMKVTYNTPVVAMADKGTTIEVTTTDSLGKNPVKREYDMVFNTTTMPALQRMDISGLKLPDKILTGIRVLSYDRATKVAIKFKTRWWKGFYHPKDRWGGVSTSDLPISNVVYPSWDDGGDQPAVLMVSYSWAQDATRIGALVPDYSKVQPNRDEPVVTLCLKNLVKLWSDQPTAPTYEFLYDQYVTHHAWAWSHDPYTGGAFALFGPGQFKNMYPAFQAMFCKKKFAMCGEALSAHHAWISGALDSAYATVLRWLMSRRMYLRALELRESSFGRKKGKHADEVDETLAYWTVALSDEHEKPKE